jgi:uncharacterized membrane protein YccC
LPGGGAATVSGMEQSWRSRVLPSVAECLLLSLACLLTFWLASDVLTRAYTASRADDLLGGLWAVISTIFVLRSSYHESIKAAVSRLSATLISFVLCLIFLIFLPFSLWGLVLLVGLSALVAMLIGRPGDAITAAITTTVVMIVAAVSPHDAWRDPILRFIDTVIGVAVGVVAAWVALRLGRLRKGAGAG